jgi:hypothetical protein
MEHTRRARCADLPTGPYRRATRNLSDRQPYSILKGKLSLPFFSTNRIRPNVVISPQQQDRFLRAPCHVCLFKSTGAATARPWEGLPADTPRSIKPVNHGVLTSTSMTAHRSFGTSGDSAHYVAWTSGGNIVRAVPWRRGASGLSPPQHQGGDQVRRQLVISYWRFSISRRSSAVLLTARQRGLF